MPDLWSCMSGVSFVAHAVVKLLRFDVFTAAVRDYRVLTHPRRIFCFSLCVVTAEFALGCALALRWEPFATIASVVLVLFFSFVTIFALLNGRARNMRTCGCIPWRKDSFVGWHVVCRNAAIITLLISLANRPLHIGLLWTSIMFACLSAGVYIVERRLSYVRQVRDRRHSFKPRQKPVAGSADGLARATITGSVETPV